MNHLKQISKFASLLFLLTIFNEVSGQMLLGGPDNMPGEVAAAPINEGSVAGNVNLFTGTYDLTHTLGTVSAINGPSFTLTASYSSIATTGTIAPDLKGYPMGDGWALNLPSISCSVEDYEKYNFVQRRYENGRRSSGYHMFYLRNEVLEEKSLHFFNVQFSIPGVGSGKLVYKYTINGIHYFAPQTFEQPLIIALEYGRWIVTNVNGDRYEFLPNPTLRRNANQRVHKSNVHPSVPYVVTGRQEGNVEPREAVTQWHCAKISNPFSTDAIIFDGEPYGKSINHFKEWDQNAFKGQPHNSAYNVFPEAYEGFFLTRVYSSVESLELNYEELEVENTPNEVEGLDILYARELVFDSENDNSEPWKRFKHVAVTKGHFDPEDDESVSSDFFSPHNPYVRNFNGQGEYVYEDENSLPLPFSHGFIETPPLDLTFTGGYHEIEFEVTNGGNPALLDLNVVAGVPGGETTNNRLIHDGFEADRAIKIHSTFQNPVKYYVRQSSSGNNGIETYKSLFLPPSLHPENKVRIQIGPSSTDQDYSRDLSTHPNEDHTMSPAAPTILSYYDFPGGFWTQGSTIDDPNIGTPNELAAGLSPLYQTDPVPSNFGTGYPWNGMINFYDEEIYSFSAGNGQWLTRSLEITEIPQFWKPGWWRSGRKPGFGEWPNRPTTTGNDISLRRLKVYRYFKKQLVLKSVKKYIIDLLRR